MDSKVDCYDIDFLKNAVINHTPTGSTFRTTKEQLAKYYLFFNNLMREYKEEVFTYECSAEEEFRFLVLQSQDAGFEETTLTDLAVFIYHADKLEFSKLGIICDKFIAKYRESSIPEKFKSVSLVYQLYGESFQTSPLVTNGWMWNEKIDCSWGSIYENFRLLDNVSMHCKHNNVDYGKHVLMSGIFDCLVYSIKLVDLYCIKDDVDRIDEKLIDLFSITCNVKKAHNANIVNNITCIIYQLLQHLYNKYPTDKNLPALTQKIVSILKF